MVNEMKLVQLSRDETCVRLKLLWSRLLYLNNDKTGLYPQCKISPALPTATITKESLSRPMQRNTKENFVSSFQCWKNRCSDNGFIVQRSALSSYKSQLGNALLRRRG